MDLGYMDFVGDFLVTRNMVYNSHREIGLVLAIKFFPEKTSPGR